MQGHFYRDVLISFSVNIIIITGYIWQLSSDGNRFVYKPNSKYRYRYRVEASTAVLGTVSGTAPVTPDPQAQFLLEADISLDVLTECEMELKVGGVQE